MAANELRVDPQPLFDLSPYLFMQLMEPLGTTDGSVEAAWDHDNDSWRTDFVATSRELSPTLIRWPGGCFSSYYRWKEAVGRRSKRKPMYNVLWGGMESNQIGTHEFIAFCRAIDADPLIAVNFESDGRAQLASFKGSKRSGTPGEAAEWVDYCNNPDNKLRKSNGEKHPFNVDLWQIGNETSYDPKGFDVNTAARRTKAFARAMRKVDPTINLIGWGCSGWARRMLTELGDDLQYIAFHHHFQSGLEDSPLEWTNYRKSTAATWKHLMNAAALTERRIEEMREEIRGFSAKLAMTESHFSAPGRNRCDVLSTWAAGVAYAKIQNVHERNGDILKIATLADFCGTRLMTNALMITRPGDATYMLPVARVMSLFRRYRGGKALSVASSPSHLDVTASRSGSAVYLHVVNTSRTSSAPTSLEVEGMNVKKGEVFEIVADPMFEVDQHNAGVLGPAKHSLPADLRWTFPPASVSAIHLHVEARKKPQPALRY